MTLALPNECESILYTAEQIDKRVAELAIAIDEHYGPLLGEGESVTLVPILSGSYMFAADLSRKMNIPNTIDFIALSSYRGSTSSTGEVKILLDTRDSIHGKHLLIIEDIIDTGYTLQFLKKLFEVCATHVLLTSHRQEAQKLQNLLYS
jgi:hypoxanthine phosphoribosyltransferase